MIVLEGVTKTYRTGNGALAAVREVSLAVGRGEWVALTGPSGSGKSTLLNLVAGLDRADRGRATVAGADLGALGEEALARWRARHVGVVFQFFQLLPTLTAFENVLLPTEFAGVGGRAERRERARARLAAVGLAHLADRLPGELSGGEQQRVATARALVNDPALVVADEPTGNLDAASGAAVLAQLEGYWRGGGTLVLATHDAALAARAPRRLAMADGRLAADSGTPGAAPTAA